MSETLAQIRNRERVAAHRARREAEGMVRIWADLPGELVNQLDQIKQERGVSSRALIIEEALRFYIAEKTGT